MQLLLAYDGLVGQVLPVQLLRLVGMSVTCNSLLIVMISVYMK